jgi:uncharacterized membrane protein
MSYFALELTGLPAVLVFLFLLYSFIYLPIKLAVIVVAHAKQKADKIRLLQQNVVIAEYEPPAKLTPAELGFLYDTKLNLAETFATITWLQQQGLVTIDEQDNQLIISNVKSHSESLKEFEKYILSQLARHQDQTITKKLLKRMNREVKKVGKNEYHIDFGRPQTIMNEQLEKQGYLVSKKEQIKRSLFRLLFIITALFLLTLWAFKPDTVNETLAFLFFILFFSPAYFVVAIFLYAAATKVAGQPWLGSAKLKSIWPEIEGYKYFIKQVELDNLKFDSEQTKGIIKNKTLPYAIALGFNTGWQDKVK